MPLADTWLDSLPDVSTKHAGAVPPGADARDVLAQFLVRSCLEQSTALTVSRAAVPVEDTVIIAVSPAQLGLLGYANEDAYRAALAAGEFVHADDLEVVASHITHRSSQPYDARLKKADDTYRRLRLHGATLLVGETEYRITTYWVP